MNGPDFIETVTLGVQQNNLEFNTLKLAEEMLEAGELLIKSVTKSGELKPSDDLLASELGDVLIRLVIFAEHKGESFQDKVENKALEKFTKLNNYFRNGGGKNITITNTKVEKQEVNESTT